MNTANPALFQASDLNRHNARVVQRRYRLLFGLMTLLLITPVLLILGTLLAKGGSAISWEFLFSRSRPTACVPAASFRRCSGPSGW
jgi:ABC-type phosphate transport system permease subunit